MVRVLIDHISKRVRISENEIQLICDCFSPMTIEKKQHVFCCGEICTYAAYVVKGAFRYYRVNDQLDEYTTRFAFDDWWIGDLQSLFNQQPADLSLQALETSTILALGKNGYDTLFSESPAFREFFTLQRNKGFEALNKLMLDKMSKTAEERYLELLTAKSPILERVPLKYIASYLGIKPESLSRIRKNICRT